jgi:hypothetical protein
MQNDICIIFLEAGWSEYALLQAFSMNYNGLQKVSIFGRCHMSHVDGGERCLYRRDWTGLDIILCLTMHTISRGSCFDLDV